MIRSSNNQQSNITPLNPKIAEQIRDAQSVNAKRAAYYRKKHKQREKRIYIIGGILMAFFGIQLLIGQVKLHASNQAVTNTQQELQSVKRKNANLKADLTQLNDPTYLQMILRDKYGYTKKGELIYNLPDKN
ncbi:septum formation initiator family protein [Leuconostoc fallax]|uniref:Septum formation initiator n=1 Tax=Leuconostoc fallax TaxID=1251 RepID=A0A4R5NAA1_9LACO|nr:septum formation initiator family protein [Leuconostoc fallax]MBU7456248.1 septum formation initiator family protein [Leuconostoc fallax]MCO6184438.1 septum formation initiator family protein [Leuconostoc fallax]TDG69073.1 hypothetical protein C5L23_001204 [Leuconostoc fallax]